MIQVLESEFSRGVSSLDGLPDSELPEIAFVGRSNVGKSSLINRLTNRKNLARTSGTPGKTQELNFYSLTLRTEEEPKKLLHFVDLPGFGYAKFSKKKREYISRLTVEYVQQREQLRVICLLNDCRRVPEEDELALRELAFESGVHCLVVLTKFDKLKQSERAKLVNQISDAYGLEPQDLVRSGLKEPTQSLWERVLPLIEELD